MLLKTSLSPSQEREAQKLLQNPIPDFKPAYKIYKLGAVLYTKNSLSMHDEIYIPKKIYFTHKKFKNNTSL